MGSRRWRLSEFAQPAAGRIAILWSTLVMVLNSLYEAPQSLERRDHEKCFKDLHGQGASAVEEEALRLLASKVDHFIETLLLEPAEQKDWRRLLRSKKVGYGGEVVSKAQRLTLAQILPGLHLRDLVPV